MKKHARTAQRTLPLMMVALVATQLMACRQEQSTQMSTQVAGRLATEKAKQDEQKIPTTVAGSEKPAEKTEAPEPDQIPGMNTSGNAFTGVLDVKSDEGKITKNTQCSIEIVSKGANASVVLNVGGYQVAMPVKKEWLKDAQSFSQEKLKAQVGQELVMQISQLAQSSYVVNVEDTRLGILRETFIANEASLGTAKLTDFINAERVKLATQKDYAGMTMISDGLYVTVDAQNKLQSFAYAKKDFVAGSGAEKGNAAGGKSIEGSFKNTLVAYCSGLKSEKK